MYTSKTHCVKSDTKPKVVSGDLIWRFFFLTKKYKTFITITQMNFENYLRAKRINAFHYKNNIKKESTQKRGLSNLQLKIKGNL